MKNKSNEQKQLPNTLLCSNYSQCNNTVIIGKHEDEALMSCPLCGPCEESLVQQAGAKRNGQDDEEEEEDANNFVPFNLNEDEAEVR
jgi:hypothetical protein